MKKVIRLTESELINVIKRIINEGQSEIDSILDKINRIGFDDLSDKEKNYLRHYSETGKYMDDEDLATPKSMADYESVFSDTIAGLDLKFKYEVTEDTPNEVIHTGYLFVNDDEFYGEIYCDFEGNYSTCSFETMDGENLFEKYEGMEHEIELFLEGVCNEINGNSTV
jgi:hypothetical protein